MGAGICAVHYIGMHAMAFSPGIVWDWVLVAEGVETLEQEGILLRIGCDELQGFRYARPMPAHLLRAWVSDEEERGDTPTLGFRDSVLTA
jgi:sensor c-di-GMP phosphodiesterase-like protein